MYILVLEVDVVKMKHENCIYSKNIKNCNAPNEIILLKIILLTHDTHWRTRNICSLLEMVAQIPITREIVEEWILSDLSNGYSIIMMVIAVLPEVDL